MLYKKYKILHRDISPGNVLVESTSSTKALNRNLDDMCFSEYLLDSNSKYVV
jgi:hypothetical protein